jgi:hypothetical protein
MTEPHPICPKCYSWKETKKAGYSRGKQRYKCGHCGRHYTTHLSYISYGKGKHNPDFQLKQMICKRYARLKEEGYSLRQFVKDIKGEGWPLPNLTHSTVLYWMKKYEIYKKTGKEF